MRTADPVHYFWRDGNDLVTPVDAATITWPLLGVPAANTITLEVTDGKGGFDSRQLVLGTSQTGDRFIGTVQDGATGIPLAGAHVDVDGVAATTDEAGAFRIAASRGERHVLTVRHPGYAIVSQVHHGPATGLALRLAPAKRTTLDPTQDIEVADGRKGATVHIPANSLVDALGHAPAGPVTVDLATYDPLLGGVPGDREGVAANQQAVTVHHTQAMSLDITDDSGRRFNLAPGHPALVTFQAPGEASPPESLTLSHFDEASGTWREVGHATRRGARYLAIVPSFSAWDIGTYAKDTACLRIAVDDGMLERPFHIRIVLTPGVVQGPWEQIGEFTVTDQTSLLYGLPPNSFGQIQISPMSDTDEILYVFPFLTNAGGLKSPPPYPYNGCTPVTLKAILPGDTWLTRMGFGSAKEAEDYYASIGARPDKDTFKKWKDANGFVTGDSESDVSFFNPNEIGLGRRANCKRTDIYPYDVACYVTKFGHVGESPDGLLDDTIDHQNPGDTVAMEFSPGPNTNGKRITKFYIFGADGNLKTHTAFDPEGDVKHVPNVCLHCHGNSRKGNDNWNGDVNGKFVTFDPTEYRYPASGAHTLASQQERFREMNAMIAYTFHHDGPGWNLMHAIYPTDVHTPGSKAIRAAVPPGWVGHETLYDKVVKPSCRTCHMYVDYSDAADDYSGFSFKGFDVSMMRFGRQRACEGEMPNAIAPMLRLWRTSNPNLMDVFSNELGFSGCKSWNEQPAVHIDTPVDGSAVGYGGLGITHFSATVSDPDDAVATLAVAWTSDEGPMGYGHAVDWVFANPGPHTVTVKVTDPHGVPAMHSITVHADETLPTMTIVKPAVGQVLYRNVAYPFLGTSYDPNEPYLTVDCNKMVWFSDTPGDPGAVGCQPQMTFTTLGTRTVTLYGEDSDNGVGSASRAVTVVDPPANSPPIVVINAPGDGDSLDNDLPVILAGSATDPDGQVTPTVTWTMQVAGGVETTIGNTLSVGWIPKNYLPQSCSPVNVTLRLYGTDPDGTRSDAVTVSVSYPPC